MTINMIISMSFNLLARILPAASLVAIAASLYIFLPLAASAKILDYRWGSDNGIIITLIADSPLPAHIFSLHNPPRLVIDLKGEHWPQDLSQDPSAARGPLPANIRGLRYHNKAEGVLRIVLDVNSPITEWQTQTIYDRNHHRHLLTLYQPLTGQPSPKPLDHAQQVGLPSNQGIPVPVFKPSAEPIPLTHNLTPLVPVPIFKPTPPLARSIGQTSYKPVIIIDPGHGGHDPGATGRRHGTLEKNITLTFAKALRQALESSDKYRVVLTRTDDNFISLRDRVALAHKYHGDLFISLHADSHHNPDVHGLSVYTLSDTASDREAAQLAAMENKEDIIIGVDLSNTKGDVTDILIDLIRQDTKNNSLRFAQHVTTELRTITNLLQRAQRSAGFRVLTSADIPSVLIEMGYLSNRNEEILLGSNSYQKRFIGALKQAIDQYFTAE